MTDVGCDEHRALIPELALGILDGRERDEALAHIAHCAECRRELASMNDLADGMVALTPSAEPPAGFETRVLGRLAAAHPAVRRVSRPHRMVALAVAAAVAAGIGIGGWAVGHHTSHPVPAATAPDRVVLTAALVTAGGPAGRVVTYGGAQPWVAMDVDSDLGDRVVRCQVVTRDGRVTTVGTFTLAGGDGYWAAPTGIALKSLASVRLVDPTGTVVATAALPSAAAERAEGVY